MQGWEPAEVTTFEYDGDRLVRSVTVREPEWSMYDVAVLLASRRRAVGPHGIPVAEATDPANREAFAGYEMPVVDYATKALEDARDRYYKAWPDANRNGHMWGVRRR